MTRQVTTLAPWFGSNRTLAHRVGEELKGCKWVGIPFAGGMSEIRYIEAPTIVVNDLHRNVINLARVAADPVAGPKLYRRLRREGFHPDVLTEAQDKAACPMYEPAGWDWRTTGLEWAFWYFIATWMNRSAKAGTGDEFKGQLPIRWTSSGGDSCTRFRSATNAIVEWRRTFRRCNFTVMDCFDFLKQVKDEDRHGLYCDAPFPGPGDDYRHAMTDEEHQAWAERLVKYKRLRIVCRFYDCDLVRRLYPETHWTWKHQQGGRDQANQAKPEVLLVNNF
jgi:DNA adenine methylase